MDSRDIKDVQSEAGIIASIILKPELTFWSEELKPNYFTDVQNAYVYYAVCELAKRGIETIDAYNITNILNGNKHTENLPKRESGLTIEALNDLISVANLVARSSVEEYRLIVEKVVDAAFRRAAYERLVECEGLCFVASETDIEAKISSCLDDVMTEFSSVSNIPQYKDVIDECWNEIKSRQGNGYAGIPFKFPTLNEYATIEPGELFIFAAEAKQGKSMMLLNCAIDLLRQNLAVLYLDSELNTRLFTARVLAHLSGIKYRNLTAGAYGADDAKKIDCAREWMKTRRFTHIYIPMFDQQSIYTTVKKVYHTQGIDVLIIDYFKGSGDGDAFGSYQELGRFVDLVKNRVCGDMKIAGLGAAQATSAGRVADSAKIGRNASTIALIQDKTPEEIEADGAECGNKKLRVVLNRNGMQHASGEYIDMFFDGNRILYREAKQHTPQLPY